MKKIFSLILALTMLSTVTVSAQSVIITGKTDSGVRAVTVLVTQKGKTIDNLSGSDIIWIDQNSVGEDGSFTMNLPMFSADEHELFTNASQKEIKERKIYVSENGTGDGMSADAPTTLSAAYEQLDANPNIVIVGNVTYSDAPSAYTQDVTITGATGTEILTLPATVSINGNLSIDNLVLKTVAQIYANGYDLEIGENVTSDKLTVFGGSKTVRCTKTSVEIYGGTYDYIYAGGHTANGYVNGNTNLIFGGNATAEYLVGGGCEVGAKVTNVTVTGGEVKEAVYGGIVNVTHNGDTHITMTGGKVQALFGGCHIAGMTGNSYITVKGGEVTRRIYGGCYNETSGLFSISWNSDHYVNGTTNIFLYPDAKLITGSGLSSTDKVNMGVFGGSRMKSSKTDETNTIFFMDDSYQTHKDRVGEKGSSYTSSFKSFHNYLVKSAKGGSVEPNGAGKVKVVTNESITALTGSKRYNNGDTITLGAETSIVYDGISSGTAEKTQTGATAAANVVASADAELIVAIYDEYNRFVSCQIIDVNATDNYTMDIPCTLDASKSYTAKFFLWQDSTVDLVPFANDYVIEFK